MFGRAKIVKLIFWKSEEFSLADEYSERKLEQQRVDWTIQQIDAQIKKTQAALDNAHQETRAVEKNFGENASINRYEVDDIAESRSELEQQRQLVARTVENETILRHQLRPCSSCGNRLILAASTFWILVKKSQNRFTSGRLL